jgi:hypothetical protein
MPMVNQWLAILKPGFHPTFYFLYSKPENETDDITLDVEAILEENCNVLTGFQRTAEWFTLTGFHLTATMASKVLHSAETEVSDLDLLQSMLKSWFNRSRSTEPMVVGARHEDTELTYFSKLPFVSHMYNVELLESNKLPRLAASLDAIVVIKDIIPDITQVAVVEVKTRFSLEKKCRS